MLVGRDAERAHLEQLLDAVASGPVGCILEGMPGIGKSTLWRDTVDSARARGFRVLDTAPSEPESLLAFSGVGDPFERLPDEVFEPKLVGFMTHARHDDVYGVVKRSGDAGGGSAAAISDQQSNSMHLWHGVVTPSERPSWTGLLCGQPRYICAGRF